MALSPIKLNYEEFCQLPESLLPHEVIDGELRMPAAPIRRHQRVIGNTYLILRPHFESRGLGTVELAPVDVVLDQERPLVVQPDLLYVSRERAAIIRDKVYGAPDLAVEVSSRSGALFDRTEKAALYAHYGVREYWLVDPEAETVEVRRLEEGGHEVIGVFRRGEVLRSTLFPELHLPVDQIFAE
jgi:Uma2 family endonuclease